jgi:hypothetical protein
LETACGPLGTEDISWQKTRLFADLVSAHTTRTTQQLIVEFWTPTDWLPYPPDFYLLDFSISSILQVKVKVTPHANLSILRRGMGQASGKIHPQDMCLFSRYP